jgi:hypothetical protein
MVRETCKECSITLGEFEKEEYQEFCIECYREQNNQPQRQKTTINIRLKNKKYFAHSLNN